jgi:sulfate-transporting ATPase
MSSPSKSISTSSSFEGTYEEYEEFSKRRLGAEADQPHRLKYRRIDG